MRRLHLLVRALAAASSLALATGALAATAAEPAASAASASGHVFSWPADAGVPATRGGSSKGAPVTLARDPSPQWQALQAPNLSPQERDRRAILAMAGSYRVSFEFLEIATYAATSPAAPYQSWGTEKVYVDLDEPGRVSLLHILEMRFLGRDGKPGEPMLTKHWRQDWVYEPASVVEYVGAETWRRRTLTEAERRGAWSQTVTQVDESPRYASTGHWEHTPSFSTWISADTWRPLPRREWTVRDDYQVLLGTNRHTITPTGWIQEENNLKTILAGAATLASSRPHLAREYGVSRYELLRDADFTRADEYHDRTRAFWSRVRDAWATAFTQPSVTLRGPVDKLGLFKPLFDRADDIDEAGGKSDPTEDAAVIKAALAQMWPPR